MPQWAEGEQELVCELQTKFNMKAARYADANHAAQRMCAIGFRQ